jgi:hypothetical protein
MSSRSTFFRKIVYLVVIAALLMPLRWLSHPATSAAKDAPASPGGKLAQLRDRYHLSQAQLGQIDPASVTIKLATLGMRGVAANILWEKANDFKMKKDWTNLGATLNQITKVQPNFINVWSNQAWNLSYNVSVEFDDYRQRYRWVMKGVDFLKEGIRYNERQPRLVWDIGWTIAEKIGRADESKQFRKLFKEDDDFHGSRPLALRDNWLVGKEWFDRAVEAVEQGQTMLGKSPLIYRSSGPMAQMYYADALERDGVFGEVAKAAWVTAARDWRAYGDQDIVTTYQDEKTLQPIVIQLNRQESHEEAARKLVGQLDALQPGLRAKIQADKRKTLTPAQREALDTPAEKRSGKQIELAAQAQQAVEVTDNEVARKIADPKKKKEALQLAKDVEHHRQLIFDIERYRSIVNFVYWRLRADVEQTDEMLATRKAIYQGNRAYAEGDLVAARNNYQQGLAGWRKVIDRAKGILLDPTSSDELMEVIQHYRRILSQLDEKFPRPFILQDVIDLHERTPAPPPKKEELKGAGEKKKAK